MCLRSFDNIEVIDTFKIYAFMQLNLSCSCLYTPYPMHFIVQAAFSIYVHLRTCVTFKVVHKLSFYSL